MRNVYIREKIKASSIRKLRVNRELMKIAAIEAKGIRAQIRYLVVSIKRDGPCIKSEKELDIPNLTLSFLDHECP